MKKPKTKDLFVKGTRICLGLIFFGISCFWGYQACLKVKTPPVGTRLQYRYGDDFKGNVEIMALTVCPDALWFYKFMEDFELISGTVMEYFARTVANSESFGFSSKRLDWDITKVVKVFKINGKEIDSNEDGVWSPVIDSVLGLCYTFNPKTFQNGSIEIKYHAKNGQIHPAEIHIEFDFTKVNDVFHDDSWFFLFAHDIEAEILYTKLSWNGIRMQRGVQYNAGGSKQVIKSISHDLSPCDTEKIGIEKACHEFKAVELFEQNHSCGLPWMQNKTLCSSQEVPKLSEVILNYTCVAHYGCESCTLSGHAVDEDNVCNGGKIVDCSSILRPCKKIDYLFGVDEGDLEDEEEYEEDSNETSQLTKVDISLQNELVTYVEEYYTYDWQSFIGEVGGTFGLFLGVSMLTTIFDLIEFIHRIFKC